MTTAPTLIQWLVGLAVDSLASSGCRKILTSGQLSVEQANAFLADLRDMPPLGDLAATLEYERFMWLDCVMMVYRTGTFGSFSNDDEGPPRRRHLHLDWDHLLRTFNEYGDRMIQATVVPGYAEHQRLVRDFTDAFDAYTSSRKGLRGSVGPLALRALLNPLAGRAFRTTRTKYLTHMMVSLLMPNFNSCRALYEIRATMLELNQIAAAAVLHRSEHGEYPTELEDLTPTFLPSIPVDRFADGPLKYERTDDGFRLYSVGKNMIDDNGVSDDDEDAEGDDIVVVVGR